MAVFATKMRTCLHAQNDENESEEQQEHRPYNQIPNNVNEDVPDHVDDHPQLLDMNHHAHEAKEDED